MWFRLPTKTPVAYASAPCARKSAGHRDERLHMQRSASKLYALALITVAASGSVLTAGSVAHADPPLKIAVVDMQHDVLTPAVLTKKQEELQKAFAELQTTYMEFQRELASKEGELTKDII